MKLKIPLWFVPNLLPGFHQRLVQHRLVKPGGPVPLTDGIQVEKGRLVAVESRLHHISHGSDCFTVQLHREVRLRLQKRYNYTIAFFGSDFCTPFAPPKSTGGCICICGSKLKKRHPAEAECRNAYLLKLNLNAALEGDADVFAGENRDEIHRAAPKHLIEFADCSVYFPKGVQKTCKDFLLGVSVCNLLCDHIVLCLGGIVAVDQPIVAFLVLCLVKSDASILR